MTKVTTSLSFIGNLLAFFCPSSSINNIKKIKTKTLFEYERKDTFQYIQKALEDAISRAHCFFYTVNTNYSSSVSLLQIKIVRKGMHALFSNTIA